MNLGGWIIMGLSTGGVTILFLWCIYKILSTPEESEHLHGFEGDTGDHDT